MTEIALEPKPSDTITVIEGFDTMRGSFWRRSGNVKEKPPRTSRRSSGARIWADGAPADPALLQDWLMLFASAGLPQEDRHYLIEPG